MKLIAQVCMHNEVYKGNLRRCMENLKLYCDDIVIYDDASTDDSVEVAREYTEYIIEGDINNQMQELLHKQMILNKSKELGATHVFWLDCDEVLDYAGSVNGIRDLCINWPNKVDGFSFKEINLWRSQTWARRDTLFDKGWFVRLWKITPELSFTVEEGVHKRLYPKNCTYIRESEFKVIHYGFWSYPELLVKIGAYQMKQKDLHRCANTNWILDERNCDCYLVPKDWYPPGCLPTQEWNQPTPKAIEELQTYDYLIGNSK